MDNITIRDMIPGEEQKIIRMARRAFLHSPFEQLGISRPKAAIVAEADNEIAGAMFLKVFESGAKKIGYLEVGFVMKAFRGRGVGRVLYPAGNKRLREMGCEPLATMVIDDNIASWKSFKNSGFGVPSFTYMIKALGLVNAVLLWLRTLFGIAGGSNIWMSGAVKERSSVKEYIVFLLINMLFFAPGFIRIINKPAELAAALVALPAVLVAGTVFGALGCLIAGGKWRFACPRGGFLLTLFMSFAGSLFPVTGRWYLKDDSVSKERTRMMGVQAIIEWLGILLIYCLAAFVFTESAFMYQCAAFCFNLLGFRLIPFMPFTGFGGARVFAMNWIVFAVMALPTLILLIYT